MVNNKNNQSGGILVIVMAISLVSVLVSYIISQQALQTHRSSHLPRYQAAMGAAEIQVRNQLNEGILADCDSKSCKENTENLKNFKFTYPAGSSGQFILTNAKIDNDTRKFSANLIYAAPKDQEANEVYTNLENSFGGRRVELDLPRVTIPEDNQECPATTPIFFGFKTDGSLDCRAPTNLNCEKGFYLAGVNPDFTMDCRKLEQVTSCDETTPIIDYYQWNRLSPVSQCSKLKDPWVLANLTPSIRKIPFNVSVSCPNASDNTSIVQTCEVQLRKLQVNLVGCGPSASWVASPSNTANDGMYPWKANIQIKAIPTNKYKFIRWDGAAIGTSDTISVSMNVPQNETVSIIGYCQKPETLCIQPNFTSMMQQPRACYNHFTSPAYNSILNYAKEVRSAVERNVENDPDFKPTLRDVAAFEQAIRSFNESYVLISNRTGTVQNSSGPISWNFEKVYEDDGGCRSPKTGIITIGSYHITFSAQVNAENKCSSFSPPVPCVGRWGSCSNGIQTFRITQNAANNGPLCDFADGEQSPCDTGKCEGGCLITNPKVVGDLSRGGSVKVSFTNCSAAGIPTDEFDYKPLIAEPWTGIASEGFLCTRGCLAVKGPPMAAAAWSQIPGSFTCKKP